MITVLGGGPAGRLGAIHLALAGEEVRLIEKRGALGGQCLHQRRFGSGFFVRHPLCHQHFLLCQRRGEAAADAADSAAAPTAGWIPGPLPSMGPEPSGRVLWGSTPGISPCVVSTHTANDTSLPYMAGVMPRAPTSSWAENA